MVGYKDTSDVATEDAEKLLKLHRKKSNNWPMVSFIHNGSEITTSSFKTSFNSNKLQNQKQKIQNNILKITASFLNFKLQIIRLAQGHWGCTPTKTAIL